jgi:hypothetical protein
MSPSGSAEQNTNRDVLPLKPILVSRSGDVFRREKGGVSFQDMRDDLTWLGQRFWTTRDDADWHHLVLAVGNFKRQTPIHITLHNAETESAQETEFTTPPPQSVRVSRDDPDTWSALDVSIYGLAVPSTTTLLSALWPENHIVIDRFALMAAVGLRASEGSISHVNGREITPEDTHRLDEIITWLDYAEYRKWALATADALDAAPVEVERTLYWLRPPSAERTVPGRTWREFGQVLLAEGFRRNGIQKSNA